jgi:hypothetical protein
MLALQYINLQVGIQVINEERHMLAKLHRQLEYRRLV